MPPETTGERVRDADDLTDSDAAILDELQKGSRTKGALVDATGLHRNTVGHRLDVLVPSGLVQEIHGPTALYELVDDPRESQGGGQVDRHSVEALQDQLEKLRARLQDAHEARDDAQARADRLESDLEDCRERLEQAQDSSTEVDHGALQGALSAAERAASEIPEGTPGRSAVQDAVAILEREVPDDA